MRKVIEKIKEEFLALLPPTIYFFVALHVIAFERSLLTRGTGIAPLSSLKVTVAALILGKSVLIADLLPLINRYPGTPLIYNVLWKSAIYIVVATLIHYLENLFDFWRTTGSLAAANRELVAHFVWAHFLAIQILLLVLVVSYCTHHELVRLVGRHRVMEIFFGAGAKPRECDSQTERVANVP